MTAYTLCEEFPSGLHLRVDTGKYHLGGGLNATLCLPSKTRKLRDHPMPMASVPFASVCEICYSVYKTGVPALEPPPPLVFADNVVPFKKRVRVRRSPK